MTDKPHILLVDDDPMMLEIERHQLGEEGYRYSTAGNGLDALTLIAADKPAIILLDIVMPDLDGLETCRRIRADADNADIHIVFVTAKDDEETRMAAYEAGGDEVLIKPLTALEIERKIKAAIDSRQMLEGLREEMASTMSMLMSTIVTSGEYGVVMNFFRNSYAARSLTELAEVVLKALDDFSLVGTVQIRTSDQILTINSARRSSPLEQDMLYTLSLENRHIYDYGSRTAFCYPNVAILIKTMPTDDPEAYGRIKDNIALLAEGAEFRLQALLVELEVRRQREILAGSVAIAGKLLTKADTDFKAGQSEMTDIFNELEQHLELAFAGLGLSEDQENGMWRVVRPLMQRARTLYDEGLALDEELDMALRALKASLEEKA
jgi:DNA-binding response OmpR family regulator